MFLELLPALQNCLYPENKVYNFQRFILWWLYGFFCLGGFLDFSQNLVSQYSENIFYLFLSWSNGLVEFPGCFDDQSLLTLKNKTVTEGT